MLLRNHSARLITVNGIENDVVKSYKVLPGDNPAADVPDKHCKSDFVKNLIKIGDLSVAQPDKQEDEPAPAPVATEQDDTESLRTQAKALGIDVDNRWGDKRLQEEIEKAQAEKSE